MNGNSETRSVIQIDNLSKVYRLGVIGHGYLIRDLQSWWARIRNREDPNSIVDDAGLGAGAGRVDVGSGLAGDFWALKNINLNVHEGDILGIIGRNGAGKSTLLKIISRVTAPSRGAVRIKGRVGSLLEVGTGFHPELTGRENIFLNGSILGMSRLQIKRSFDEIVDFAEVEQFLDTPVKRYSSGMHVRLAFAVAAHLEPEILLVDEVLAVGDIRFQRKCIGKMKSVSSGGTTVIFVSHNMSVINSLCTRCMLLDSGRIIEDGNTADIVLRYFTNGKTSPARFDTSQSGKEVGDDYITLHSGEVTDIMDQVTSLVSIADSFKVRMRIEVKKGGRNKYVPTFHFLSGSGQYAFISTPGRPQPFDPGIYTAECTVPGALMNDETYFVGLGVTSFDNGVTVHFFESSCLSFVIQDNSGLRDWYGNQMPGVVRPRLDWNIVKED